MNTQHHISRNALINRCIVRSYTINRSLLPYILHSAMDYELKMETIYQILVSQHLSFGDIVDWEYMECDHDEVVDTMKRDNNISSKI